MDQAITVQRWRYQKPDGTPVWLPFSADFPCLFCNEPVRALSFGGPGVCPSCDCGNNRDGSKWTPPQYSLLVHNFKRRLAELPDDPAWQTTEEQWKAHAREQEAK